MVAEWVQMCCVIGYVSIIDYGEVITPPNTILAVEVIFDYRKFKQNWQKNKKINL